jgi:hypothetical protein
MPQTRRQTETFRYSGPLNIEVRRARGLGEDDRAWPKEPAPPEEESVP